MKAPRRVKIGFRDFDVQMRTTQEMNEERALGLCVADRAVIFLDEGLDPQLMAETLLHETLHAVWHVQCLPAKLDEEKAVTGLSKGLAGVLRDNPELVKFIIAGLSGK